MTEQGSPRGDDSDQDVLEFTVGQTLYDERGEAVGDVRGVDEGGVFLTTRSGQPALSIEHVRTAHRFGEAELMWRCMTCGEMGTISDGLPDRCPGCASGREELMYWTED
jgi:hypothetical protein